MNNFQQILNSVRQQTITKQHLDIKIKKECPVLANTAFDRASTAIQALSIDERTTFCEGYTLAISDMLYNLANWEDSSLSLVLPQTDRILFIAWQFPELPLLFRQVYELKALITVFQKSPWLKKLESADCIVNSYSRQGQRKIEREMANGRLIGTTVDDVRKPNRSISASFFGRQVYTNTNIIVQAVRHHYTIIFLAPSNGQVIMTSILSEGSFSVADAVKWINHHLQEQIAVLPQRWLMWPSMNYRFNSI